MSKESKLLEAWWENLDDNSADFLAVRNQFIIEEDKLINEINQQTRKDLHYQEQDDIVSEGKVFSLRNRQAVAFVNSLTK